MLRLAAAFRSAASGREGFPKRCLGLQKKNKSVSKKIVFYFGFFFSILAVLFPQNVVI